MELRARDLQIVLDTMMDAAEAADEPAFADRILLGVDRLIPSDIRTYNVIDVRSHRAAVVTQPLAALSPAALARFSELVHQHPLIMHFDRRPADTRALAISDFLSRRALHATELHHDFFARVAVEDQLAINLPTGDGTVIGIAVNRADPSFTPRERELLELFRGHVARSLRALRERRLSAAMIAALERGVETAGAGLVVFARARVLHVSADAEQLLGGSLPPPVATALAAGLDPPAIVEHCGRRLQLALARGQVDVLIVRERPAPAAALGLTARELAVLEHVRDGLGDREIAEALGVSPRTVHHHLQNAYAKLGVRSRTAAVARVFRASE